MAQLLLSFAFVILIVGCIDTAESRAVNISNTWTLPQEGFSVFYRYFRDKISWFEADAVCQFHHANLVTVDNGVQFDATRAFLKELDVTSAVWIGLMRPENSARFTWTSSKSLDPTSGYWAEAIPAMEQPLCAVVDPVRDFRWHALRCGGPETAAFLCELPVPSWAVDCTVTSIPSLTVQYMSDSGTVQLSRDCGESGTKHISCQGKQDRDSIIEQLQCSDEEDLASVLASDNGNQLPGAESAAATASSTRRPQQPILEHDILTVVSSNDEESNNKIEVNPNQIEDTVKNVINKFNLQDLMRSEQAAALHSDEVEGVGRGVVSPRKSGYGKKYSPLYEKKNHYAKKNVNGGEVNESVDEEDEEEEPMMGDQPMQDETETQPIDIIQQAVKPTADGDYADPAAVGSGVKIEETTGDAGVTPTETVTTPDSRLRRGTDSDREEETTAKPTEPVSNGSTASDLTVTTTASPTTVPSVSPTTIASSTPPALLTTRTTASSHILPTTPKKEVITGDHFIPPMLLVKARFISARPQTEAPPTTVLPTASSTNLPVEPGVTDPNPTGLATSESPFTEDQQKLDASSSAESTTSEGGVIETSSAPAGTDQAHQVVHVVFEENDSKRSEPSGSLTITTRPFPEAEATSAVPSADPVPPESAALVSTIQLTQHSDSFASTAAPELDTAAHSSEAPKMLITTSTEEERDITTVAPEMVETNASSKTSPSTSPQTTTAPSTVAAVTEQEVSSSASELAQTTSEETPSSSHETITAMPFTSPKVEPTERSARELPSAGDEHQSQQEEEQHHPDNHTHEDEHDEDDDEHAEQHSELHNSFSNVENYQPYKPNRHRSLTKPEVHNNHGAYIKKILG